MAAGNVTGNQPIPSSSTNSTGVPQAGQIAEPQSAHRSGVPTGVAHSGQ
jgi:hypothetical protein